MKRLLSWLTPSVLLLSPLLTTSCGDDKGTAPAPDTVPPATVKDLAVESTAPGVAFLRWTAPGDDGFVGTATRYDLRYSSTAITASNWDSATAVGPLPVPMHAGTTERYHVTKLKEGSWHFRLRAVDEVENVGGLSNMADARVPSFGPLLRVSDLAVKSSAAGSVTLAWTAPGSQAAQVKALEYDLRYSLASITEANFNDAIRVQSLPVPASAGTRETFTVTGLTPTTTFFFALEAADENGNWSSLSNTVSETTALLSYDRLTISSRLIGATYAAWSPDGEDIVFAADWREKTILQLYRMRANGDDPVALTNVPGGVQAPSWSPDGTKLAFAAIRRDDLDTYYELSIMAPDPGAPRTVLATYQEQSVGVPSWSPDGTRLVYAVNVSFQPRVSEIYTIFADGGTPVLLASAAVNGTQPVWSPDGTKIAFSSNVPPYGIRVMPAAGGDPVQLTSGSTTAFGHSPVWSPDGTRITFSSDRAGNADIWVMSSSGENPTRLTASPEYEFPTSWSPDGRAICVSRRSGSGQNWSFDIWVLHL